MAGGRGATDAYVDLPDHELAARAGGGDDGAFTELVGRHRGLLDTACAAACPDLVDREDAIQHALVDIWRGLPGFRGDAKVSTWMYRVAQHAARRHAKRSQRAPLASEPEPDGSREPVALRSEWNAAVDLRDALVSAIRALPEDHADALLLHTQAGLSLQEIADMKFAAVGTVKSWIHRARTELARTLEATER